MGGHIRHTTQDQLCSLRWLQNELDLKYNADLTADCRACGETKDQLNGLGTGGSRKNTKHNYPSTEAIFYLQYRT